MWVWLVFALIVVVTLLTRLVIKNLRIIFLYASGVNEARRGNSDLAIKRFQKCLEIPSAKSNSWKVEAIYRLAYMKMTKGDYDGSVDVLKSALNQKISPSTESNLRQRLSEALEGAGRPSEAEEERLRASNLALDGKENAASLLAEASILSSKQQYVEQYALLERALPLIPLSNSRTRAKTMTSLALAAYNSGQTTKICKWGEAALALEPDSAIASSAHGACGLGYSSLGDLDGAERHRKAQLELETKVGNPDKIADAMAQLASIHRRRGNITESMRMCAEAKEKSALSRMLSYGEEMECLKLWGRFHEAIETLELIRKAQQFPNPSARNRMKAAYDANEAILLLELGRPEEAFSLNRDALLFLQNDKKLSLIYSANQVWILAQLHRREEALELVGVVETRLKDFSEAMSVQKGCLQSLGRAYLELQDYRVSLAYWERNGAFKLDPTEQGANLYFQGLCHIQLENFREAEVFFKQTVALNIDTMHTKAASDQLKQISH